MAVIWSYPVQPLGTAAGTGVTAASLTAGTPAPPPVMPPIQLAGTTLWLEAHGELTSTSATPTVILGFYLGAVGGAIGSAAVLAVTAALPISATATAWPFHMRYWGTFRSLTTSSGGNAVIHGSGTVESWFNVGLSGDGTTNPMPITAALRTVSTINTYQNNQLDVGITLSSVTGTPSVTVTDFAAELRG